MKTRPLSGRHNTILLWRPVSYIWSIKMSLKRCSVAGNSCRLTTDRRQLDVSDAVVFHFRNKSFDRLPTCRRSNQGYVYLNFESAIRSRSDYPWGKIPRNFFNLTATYRLDSDLTGRTYGGYQFKPKKEFAIQHKSNDWTNYYGINITSKTKIAAWFVSNCKTSINREGYVRELRNYIPVDVFGKCLENPKSCLRERHAECEAMLKRDYLFYLSFENSFCPDYVTEKLYTAFETGTIPVVFGGANYSLFAPPHTYINARDFKTPKLLAEYLIHLRRNLDLYSRYFDWKGKFNLQSSSGWTCKLCQMLHADLRVTAAKSYEVIEKWFFDKQKCENYQWSSVKG
jgi:alpha-1,3-fucosyltransferase